MERDVFRTTSNDVILAHFQQMFFCNFGCYNYFYCNFLL